MVLTDILFWPQSCLSEIQTLIFFFSQTFRRNTGSSLMRINQILNSEAEPSVTFIGHSKT